MKRYIGDKQFYKTTLLIALPIMAQQFITTFVNLIDNIMIGSVGDIALTSVTVANKFYNIFSSTMFGVGGAAGIFIAQYYGAKNKDKCQKIFNISLIWGIIAAVLFTVILFITPEGIMHIFTKTPEIVDMGVKYLNYAKFTYLPFAISFCIASALRSTGINNIQLYVGIVAVVINTTLNYVLIYGNFGFPAMGVEGAAIATSIARIVEMGIYILVLVNKKHYFELDISGLIKLDFSLMKSMFTKALPLIANEIFFSLGIAMVFKSYLRVDEYRAAAISIIDTVSQILFVVFSGLSSAVSILIGKTLGANKLDEARENARKLLSFAIVVACLVGSVSFIGAKFVPDLYNIDQTLKDTVTILLRVKSISIIIHAFDVCIFFILRSGGDSFSTFIMDSGFMWGGSVLVSTVLSMFTSISLIPLYMIVESLEVIKMCLSLHLFKKERWVNNMTEQG